MLLFSQKTGVLCGILLDEGYLTDLRTAMAGAIVAKYLAPHTVNKIGIIGTGIQAKLQLHYLKNIINCKDVVVFGRNDRNLLEFKVEMEKNGFQIITTKIVEEVTSSCNLIVTTTPATSPILFAEQIKKVLILQLLGRILLINKSLMKIFSKLRMLLLQIA